MQINVHIPRSAIREGRRLDFDYDPFNVAVTNAVGDVANVGFTEIFLYNTGLVIPMSRSLYRAMKKYVTNTLDAPVRFRITIPEVKG